MVAPDRAGDGAVRGLEGLAPAHIDDARAAGGADQPSSANSVAMAAVPKPSERARNARRLARENRSAWFMALVAGIA